MTEKEKLPASAGEVISQLMAVIEDRRENPPERSYTTSLFRGGVDKIGGKILEEAQEVVEAAGEAPGGAQREHLIYEACDLLYHLFVLLGYQQITLPEVSNELARRFGIGGLDEKASRTGAARTEDGGE